ncbi:MAG: Ig-like domain-containing protein [Elusimicrobiota bacterium]
MMNISNSPRPDAIGTDRSRASRGGAVVTGALALLALSLSAAPDRCAAADFVPEIVATESGANFHTSDIGANASGLTAVFCNSRLFSGTGTGWKRNLVDPIPTHAYWPTVLVDSAGTTHAFYASCYSGYGTLYHAEFAPGLAEGASSPPAETVGNGCRSGAVEDVDGNIHIVYIAGGVYHRVRSGGVWSAPQQISIPGAYFDVVALRLGSDGRTLHLSANQTNGVGSFPAGIQYATKAPGGSWTFETAMPNVPLANLAFSLAVDGQTPYLIYADYVNHASAINMARRSAGGTWSAEYLVTGVQGAVQFLDAEALNGFLYVTYSGGSGGGDDNRPWMIKKVLPDGAIERQAIAERTGYADSPRETVRPALTVGAGKPSTSYTYNRWRIKGVMDLTNSVPAADAGPDKQAAVGSPVTLTGIASDLDNDPLTVGWAIEDPSGAVTTQSGYTASFSPSAEGFYVATFNVADARGARRSDYAVVYVPTTAAPIKLGVSETVDASVGGTPDVAYDAEGYPYIYSNGKLFKKTASGWVHNTLSPVGKYNPKVIVGPSGSAHVFYSNWSTVYYTECPAGLADGAACPPSISVGSGYYIAAAQDAGGKLHLMYYSAGIQYRSRTAGVWSAATLIHGASPINWTPLDLRVDPDGYTLHAAFQNAWNAGVPLGPYYARKGPSDATWTIENIGEFFVSGTQLVLDGTTPIVVFGRDSYLKMATRGQDGSWKQEFLATGLGGGIQWLDADFSNGSLHAIVRHGSGSSDDWRPVYVTKAVPSGLPQVRRVTADPGSDYAAIAASGDEIHIAYNTGPAIKYIWNGPNQRPIANPDSITVNEGGSAHQLDSGEASVLANDTDEDGDPLTAIKVANPSHGRLWFYSSGSFNYRHDGGESTSDSFQYKANDGVADSAVATVSITINPVNDTPAVTNPGAQSGTEGDSVSLQIVASDPEASALTYGAPGLPDGLSIDPGTGLISGTLSYHSAGAHTVTATATDPEGASGSALFSWSVENVNRGPTAVDDGYSTDEDVVLSVSVPAQVVLANDSDPDGEPLTAILVSDVSRGLLALNANGAFVYQPGPNLNGVDSFSYKVTDGELESDPASVTITVNSVNDQPTSEPPAPAATEYGAPMDLFLSGSDVDDAVLTLQIVSPPKGSLVDTVMSCQGGQCTAKVTYDPAGFAGTDSFAFGFCDAGGLCSASREASIDVTIYVGGQPEITFAGEEEQDLTVALVPEADANAKLAETKGKFSAVGNLYDLGPEATTFVPPAVLSMCYDPSQLPPSANEKHLNIFIFTLNQATGADEWLACGPGNAACPQPALVDAESHCLMAEIHGPLSSDVGIFFPEPGRFVRGGRRPAVDDFLVYAGAVDDKVTTILGCAPGRVTQLILVTAVGGETVFPETAQLELNGVPLAVSAESLTQRGIDFVALPLEAGTNVLLGSIDGYVPGTTRVASDTERLVIKCE